MICWERATKADMRIIRRIARRAHSMLSDSGIDADIKDVTMDITAAHCGCPLDLQKFESADDFNFAHEVIGIRNHLDRETGELTECFVPRCAIGQ